jgi:nitrous oxide reductase accessory protein NosL
MDKIYYVIKDGHCLDKFDNEENANKYAKKVGGIVTEYNKYDNYYKDGKYYEILICKNLPC